MVRRRPWPSREACLEALLHGDGTGVKIAVLDTGLDAAHPDFSRLKLAGVWKAGADACHAAAPADPVGHGTGIAGIIHRLAPRAELMAITVLGADLRQRRHEAIRSGALHAIREGAAVLNCSFGVPGTAYALPFYKDWTDHAFHCGRLVVAASSNDDPSLPEWPAFFPQVLGIAAGELAPEVLEWCEEHPIPLKAAGSGVTVPVPGGGHARVSGSSFAAAHVSGLLARLLSAHPGLSPSMAREALEHFAKTPVAASQALREYPAGLR